MSTIADLLIKVRADTGGAEKELTTFGSKAGAIAKKALVPAVAVMGGLGLAAKKAADDATNLGESQNAVNVVFGKSANVVAKFSRVADTQAGLSMRQLNELVTPIGASLINMGDSADVAAKKSVALAKRAADMASVFNVDVGEALGAIQAGLRGEADPLERFGVGLSDAAVRAKAVQMGLAKTASAVTDAGRSQARYALLMDQTNKLQGDFVNTSDSAANAARINTAAQENLRAKLGAGVLPAYKMVQGIIATVTGVMSEHTGAVKIVTVVALALAAAVIAVNVAMKVYAAGVALAQAATGLWTAAQWLLNAALSANPIGIVIVALAAIAAAIVVAYRQSETFRNVVNAAFGVIKTAVTSTKDVFDKLLAGIKAVVTWVQNNWKTIALLISGPFAPLVALATNAFGIRSALTGALTGIKTFVSTTINSIVGFFRELPGRIVGFAENMGTAFVNGAKRGLRAFGGALADLVKAPLNALIGAWNGLGIPGFDVKINMPGPVPDINFGWGGMSLPDIPRLAIGTNMVNADGMAFLHAGEAVVPADVAGGGFAGGGGVVFAEGAIQINGSLIHERDLEQAIQDALIRVGRRNGGNVFGGAVTV